jgi:dimethylhistidine N-methyltransferase
MTALNSFLILDRLPASADAKVAILAGLAAAHPYIEPRYFYDPLGCALYEAITRLSEYYPTQTEIGLLTSNASAIASAVGPGAQMIDLGSGDSIKAGLLLPSLTPSGYVAVDIARSAIEAALPRLLKTAPQVQFCGVVTDFANTLDVGDVLSPAQRLFFYPGSSIGNFDPAAAQAFVARIRAHCRAGKDWLLIGVDSVKASERLTLAYDDPLGVTAAFNLNVLRHVNAIAHTDFDVRDWRHIGIYNEQASRIEMELEARVDVLVRVGEREIQYPKGARIHTENSYKYTRARFEALLSAAGFEVAHYFTDSKGDFHAFLARAR